MQDEAAKSESKDKPKNLVEESNFEPFFIKKKRIVKQQNKTKRE
jgi:hypothetical protein